MVKKIKLITFEQGTGKKIKEEMITLTPEQEAEEIEREEMQKILNTLGQSWNAAKVEENLKKLIQRLMNKGILP